MTEKKDKNANHGEINVTMGDQNKVDHIGHKITYSEPAPSPNAIWQDGWVVGEIGSAPQEIHGRYQFEKLFVGDAFDHHREFEVQGVRLHVLEHQSETSVSIGGRPPQRTLWGTLCDIVKDHD
jgi:hypothetical protein